MLSYKCGNVPNRASRLASASRLAQSRGQAKHTAPEFGKNKEWTHSQCDRRFFFFFFSSAFWAEVFEEELEDVCDDACLSFGLC